MLIALKSKSLNLLEPSGSVQACSGTAVPFFLHIVIVHICYFLILSKMYINISSFPFNVIHNRDCNTQIQILHPCVLLYVFKYTLYSKTCLKRNAIVPVFFFFQFSQVSVLQRVVF